MMQKTTIIVAVSLLLTSTVAAKPIGQRIRDWKRTRRDKIQLKNAFDANISSPRSAHLAVQKRLGELGAVKGANRRALSKTAKQLHAATHRWHLDGEVRDARSYLKFANKVVSRYGAKLSPSDWGMLKGVISDKISNIQYVSSSLRSVPSTMRQAVKRQGEIRRTRRDAARLMRELVIFQQTIPKNAVPPGDLPSSVSNSLKAAATPMSNRRYELRYIGGEL